MQSSESQRPVVKIGVFAAQQGWLLTHPSVQSRFEARDDAMAAAKRLAHLETWRGRQVDILVQEANNPQLSRLDLRA